MAKTLRKRIALAQHFLCCPILVRALVQESTVGNLSTVLELGAGTGILTAALAQVAGRVIAVEKDPALVARLRRQFCDQANVTIIAGDFFRQQFSLADYVLFANLPFNHTAETIRWISRTPVAPSAASLLMQREAAQKFAGTPSETLVSVLLKPRYELAITKHLQRSDFDPPPSVEVVMLQMKQRDPPLLTTAETRLYEQFVRFGFRHGKRMLRLTYQSTFTHTQWKRLARNLHFARNTTPSQLNFAQWLALFRWFQTNVPTHIQQQFARNSTQV